MARLKLYRYAFGAFRPLKAQKLSRGMSMAAQSLANQAKPLPPGESMSGQLPKTNTPGPLSMPRFLSVPRSCSPDQKGITALAKMLIVLSLRRRDT